MKNRSLLIAFFVSILMCCLVFVSPVSISMVQGSSEPSFNISGYILDSDGNGVAGANIIFNVPDIVPSVFSDSSGYYLISAPAGTYHINVWPPFDSSYIHYDEVGFVVGSDITKNITLNSGWKVSGFISDSFGNPVRDAIVSLNNYYLSGWFSKDSGYYFVCAPDGTYELRVTPRSGYNHFTSYFEDNFTVSGNIMRNFTVGGHSSPSTPQSNIISVEVQPHLDGKVYFTNEKIHSSPRSVKLVVPEKALQGSYAMALYQYGGKLSSISSFSIFSSYTNATPRFMLCLEKYGRGWADTFLLSDYQFPSDGEWKATTGGNRWGWTETNIQLTSYGTTWDTIDYWVTKYGDLKVTHIGILLEYWAVDPNGFGEPLYADELVINGVTYNIQPAIGSPSPSPTPTPSPSPTPSPIIPNTLEGNIIFFDNFDDGVADGWTQWDGSWRVNSEEYCVSVGIVENGLSTVDNLNLADCAIETKLRFTDSVGFRSGIVFRFIDPTHYYSVELGNEYDTLDIVKYSPEDPNYGDVIAQLRSDGLFQKDTVYQLNVVIDGDFFRCFINGDQVLTGTDNSYTHGSVGLRARRADVCFDDFKIESSETSSPTLVVSCKKSTFDLGFKVQIDGCLTLDEASISEAPILLSYSVNGGKSWQDLTLVYTGFDGRYSATWVPSVTGNYLLRAVYEGNADTLGATSEIVDFAVMQVAEDNIFSVSSNSTVTALTLNSSRSELSFIVSGPSETTGYVEILIAKSLVTDVENVKVYLNENEVDYEVTSSAESWLLSFTYQHSTHHVRVSFAANEAVEQSIEVVWIGICAAVIVVLIGTYLLLFYEKPKL